MNYTKEEAIEKIRSEEAEFVCLTFCDIYGKQKNITIMPEELERAFESGISLDASLVEGFRMDAKIDLMVKPDPDTLCVLPESLADSEMGRVVRMQCHIYYPDGRPFENDPRFILKQAVATAEKRGLQFNFGPAMEFYLFEEGKDANVRVPHDNAGYMASVPADRCEVIRREICRDLKKMGIRPECAYHEEGPGQNKIKFRFNTPIEAADAATAYKAVVRSVAARYGLDADFSPKPLERMPGSSMHVNMSVVSRDGMDRTPDIIAGILAKAQEITVFLNPTKKSYKRLGHDGSVKYVSWSDANRSTLIRIPAYGGYTRFELRSPDNGTNPYIAFALLIYAALYGIDEKPTLQKASEEDLFEADSKSLSRLKPLPSSLTEAQTKAKNSLFVREHLPMKVIDAYVKSDK